MPYWSGGVPPPGTEEVRGPRADGYVMGRGLAPWSRTGGGLARCRVPDSGGGGGGRLRSSGVGRRRTSRDLTARRHVAPERARCRIAGDVMAFGAQAR